MNKRGSCSNRTFPGGGSDKEPSYQCRRHKRCGFDPLAQRMPWRRVWHPPSVFLPGKSHGQRSLASYSPCFQRGGQHWSDLACMHMLRHPKVCIGSLFCMFYPAFIVSELFGSAHRVWCEVILFCSCDLHRSYNEQYWAYFHVPGGYVCLLWTKHCLGILPWEWNYFVSQSCKKSFSKSYIAMSSLKGEKFFSWPFK